MEFLETVGSRRSIRFFRPWKPVERWKIQTMLECARLGPSSGNTQACKAIVVWREELPKEKRERLLELFNWQTQMVLAPVWIFWLADASVADPDKAKQAMVELMKVGALPATHGWSEEEVDFMLETGQMRRKGLPFVNLFSPKLANPAVVLWFVRVDAAYSVSFAVLAATELGLGSCLLAIPPNELDLRPLLGYENPPVVPFSVLVVGYPAEDPVAGGQRPRRPFEQTFFESEWGKSFRRDLSVVEHLKAKKLIQQEAPLPERFQEIDALGQMLNLPIE